MRSTIDYETCDFYDEHNGVEHNGCYEFTDVCYVSMRLNNFKPWCTENWDVCPMQYKIKRGN